MYTQNLRTFLISPIGYEIPCGIRRLSTTDDRRIVNGTDAVMGKYK